MKRKKVLENFVYNYLLNAIIISCLIFIMFCIYIIAKGEYDSYIFDKYQKNICIKTKVVKYELQNINWDECEMQEKMDIIHKIVDNETYALQVTPVTIRRENIIEENYHTGRRPGSYYSPNHHVIVFYNDFLLDASLEDIVSATCHEMYHAYEYSLALSYQQMDGFDKIKYYNSNLYEYSLEFDNYISNEMSYEEYYAQAIESDSRKYADKRITDYLE